MDKYATQPPALDTPSPKEDGRRRIRRVAWALIAAGVIETLILIDAVRSGYSFSGGAFFYIFAGLALRFGEQTTYRRISGAATIFLSLMVGGVAILLVDTIFFFSVRQVDTSFDPEDPFLLLVLAYAAVLPWLVYNLYHPNTRACFELPTTNGSLRTLFLPRVRFLLVVVGAIAFMGLLGGPHLIRNPFTAIAHALTQSGDVSSRLGKPRLIELHTFRESNWHVLTKWTVTGEHGSARYMAMVSPSYEVSIQPEQEDSETTVETEREQP